jgi:[CysO sulfur-carrier protein]-S-L-cysteine hydrolase
VFPLGSKKRSVRRYQHRERSLNLKGAAATPKKDYVLLPKQLYRSLMVELNKELPNEACGLISGIVNRCMTLWPMKNIEPSPYSFAMDVNEQEKAVTKMKAKKEAFIGIYHSHPYGDPFPSRDDIAFASHDAYYFIASVGKKREELRCYKIINGKVSPIEIVIL